MLNRFEIRRDTVSGRLLSIIVNYTLQYSSIRWKRIYIGHKSSIYTKIFIIEKGSRINGSIHIKGAGKASIGKYCALGDGIRIITGNHEIHIASIQLALQKRIRGTALYTEENVTIGNDVWIGDAAIILPGVKVGDGAVIAAGSVVTKSILPYRIVAGIPACFIKERCSMTLAEELRDIKWWNWSERTMKIYKNFFTPWNREEEMLQRIKRVKEKMSHDSSS